MDTSFIAPFVQLMQALSSETLSLLIFLACVVFLLFLFRTFGIVGLYLYNAVIVIVANVQVLKTATFCFSPEPVALGTITFATTYLVSDILTEHYGKAVAHKGVWLSFAAHILMTSLMIATLGYSAPVGDKVHGAMMTLFTPSPRILLAGLLAYVISQFLGIYVFERVGRMSQRRWLWLRTNVATLLSGLVDNAIFSVFAWVILNPEPITFYSLIFTYILGTYLARVLVAFLSTPVMYLSYWCLPKPQKIPILN
ncbi:MAG: queuosine precursor transporter [Candidatus Paracaedibacter sp.]